jgi:putative hemolysin
MRRYLLVVFILGGLVIAACGGTEVPPTRAVPDRPTTDTMESPLATDDVEAFESPIGLPNPASKFCEDNGYKLEMREEAGGTVGYCLFPDGSECEEWAYYRGECQPPSP